MRFLSCLALFALLPLSTSLAQGLLTPPAAPAPTMKTLDQVEPRILIGQADVPMTITNKGSYLLTGNLTMANGASITVDADDVAIDLNGFTIASGGYGIEIASGRGGTRIRNGTIRDTSDAGVYGPTVDNVELRNLRIVNCLDSVSLNDHARVIDCVIDTSGEGAVSLQRNAFVRDCAFCRCSSGEDALFVDDGSEVRETGFEGLSCAEGSFLEQCTSIGNGRTGIFAREDSLLVDCIAKDNAAQGIYARAGSLVRDCLANGNGQNEIQLQGECVVRHCVANNNGSNGIYALDGSHVEGNSCWNNGDSASGEGAGIRAGGGNHLLKNNYVSSNQLGFHVSQSSALLVANTAVQNGTNFVFSGFAHYGEIYSSPGPSFTNSNPWANSPTESEWTLLAVRLQETARSTVLRLQLP